MEVERRRGVGSRGAVGQAGVDHGVGRGRVDREGAGSRGLVLVAGGVLGPELNGVGAVAEAAEGLRRGAVGEGGAVELALDLGRVDGWVAVEIERRRGVGGRGVVGQPGVDHGVGRRRVGRARGVDGERARGRRRVPVAERVLSPERDRVGAVAETRERLLRGAVGERLTVELALDLGRVADRVAAEAVGGRVGRDRGAVGRAGVDQRVRGGGIDGERPRGGGLVLVAERVLGAELDGVGAVTEARERLRRGAVGERAAVELALELGGVPGRVAVEAERRRGVGGRGAAVRPASIMVSGAVVSTVKVREAGVGSRLPAASSARNGDGVGAVAEAAEGSWRQVQSAKRPSSSLHWSFAVSAPGLPWKAKLGESSAIVRRQRAGVDRRVRWCRAAARVDGEGARGRRGVVVAGGVLGPERRRCGQPSVRPLKLLGRGAVGEGAVVELALDLRRVRRRCRGRRSSASRWRSCCRRGTGVDRRVRRGGVGRQAGIQARRPDRRCWRRRSPRSGRLRRESPCR